METVTTNFFSVTYVNTRTVQDDVRAVAAFDKAMKDLADKVSAN